MGYIGMCDPKGYGFLPALVRNRVSILVVLVSNRVWFLHSCLELGVIILEEAATFSSLLITQPINKALHLVTDTGSLNMRQV